MAREYTLGLSGHGASPSKKMFGGKWYSLRGMPGYKVDANALKKNLQQRGFSVRITKTRQDKGHWLVWCR